MRLSYFYLTSAFAAIVLSVQLAKIFYNVFLSPLRKIPGPWYNSVTGIPSRFASTVQKRQAHYAHELHKKYGPYVRFSPNEVLISDPAAFREIHKAGTHFYKTDLYKFLNPTKPGEGPYGMFQATDPAQHSRHRKLLGKGFTQNYLRSNWEGRIQEKAESLIQYLKSDAKKSSGEVDIYKWLPLFAGDVIAELAFGQSFGMMERGKPDEIITYESGNTFAYAFPLLYQIVRWIPHPRIQSAFGGNQVLLKRGRVAVENSKANAGATNLFAKAVADAEKGDTLLTDEEIVIEAGDFLFAGTDTTATTLTYLIWSVLRDQSVQKDIEDEVAELTEPYSDEQLEQLPVLSALVKETLRLYGAAPAALPRITPPEGAILGGHEIPAGTTVATQAWSMHRDPNVFTDPEVFDHTRWLDGTLASREDVKRVWSPYGAGSRICVGSNLANMELRIATAAFFRNCRGAKLAPSTTDASMEVENVFLIAPKAMACKVVIPAAE
ncbi:hypothetical protein CKM354_000546200 [Cercospora kikuchii]|uniref:Cytochrome P450 monooxygenase n=1 Tax=Cercospora kikuchii TaxID=84275 RepID=A0A9P3CFZ8_9PEZI|nr:uncharacterized protein CKM354_000546200 [Cercospora kikuchii]GIZ42184.1 hypothetical protein CKM354_000546200 [Cercospora kikuchii]